ncbi:MAG: hypothetical protein PUA96_04045 [Bacteroidales bacterium]|nr:hypothetical protein [Bacteroidales bacterium]
MKKIKAVSLAVLLISVCGVLRAQDGAYSSYSPYTIFGVGDIYRQGTAYNQSMGGVGIASRNNRFINYLNPAAVTARDTLSFMLDFGVTGQGRVYKQGDVKSANNIFNICNFVFSVPIYRKSAFFAGITPYSSLGYDFSHDIVDQSIIGNTGNVNYRSYGDGGMYQIFFGAGATFWNRFSVGAQFLYYFGNMDKSTIMDFATASYRDIYSGYKLNLSAVGGKFGVQYDQPLSSGCYLTAGATYKTSSKLRGYVTDYKYATVSSVSDTLHHHIDTLKNGSKAKLASEVGFGLAFRKGDKWRVEFDYTFSDWSGSHLEETIGFANIGDQKFTTTFSQSFRAGFEIIPNKNDIRYYMKKCAYRVGTYYEKEYYKLNGDAVRSYGVTLGITLPVFQWYNGISIGVDIGQRGSTKGNMIRENYAMFVVGFNIHDIWFRKYQYD